jgi:hypothetical protein
VANGQFQILAVDVRPPEWAVGLQPRDPQTGGIARLLYSIGVVEHRDSMEIAGLAHELAAKVNHGLEVFVAHLCGGLDRPLERFVGASGELGVEADSDPGHNNFLSLVVVWS